MTGQQIATDVYQVAYRTDVGRKRTNNEDFVGAVAPSNVAQLKRDGLLMVVADGVGGHEFGERASQYVVKTLLKEYYRMPNVPPEGRLTRIISQASQSIHAHALKELGEGKRMATTVVAAVLRDDTVQIAHVGDSRAYLIRDGKAHLLTRDHSFVAEKVRAGLMTPEEAERSKFRSRLTQSVGGSEEVTVDVTPPIPLVPGDQILLCSDGLTRYVSDEELGKICSSSSPPQEIVERLIHLANERGGADNITAALARYQPTAIQPRSAKPGKGLNAWALRLGGVGLAMVLAFLMGVLVRGWWGGGSAPATPTPAIPAHLALPTVPTVATPEPQSGTAQATLQKGTAPTTIVPTSTPVGEPSPSGAPVGKISPLPQAQPVTWPVAGAQGNVKRVVAAGDKAAVLFDTGRLYLATVASSVASAWQPLNAQGVTALALSPDGQTLVVGRQDGTVTFHSTAALQQATGTLTVKGKIQAIAFSPDGKALAIGDDHGEIWQARLEANAQWHLTSDTPLLQTGGQPIRGLALASRWLAVALPDGVRVAQWPNGKELKAVEKSPAEASRVAFTPDGQSLMGMFADQVALWQFHNGKWQYADSRPFPGHLTGIACPTASVCVLAVATPNGNLDKGEVVWINPFTLRPEASQMLHELPVGGVAVLSDQRVLVGITGGLLVVAQP